MKQAAFLALFVLAAFAVEEDKRLVYGTDDRTEPYSISDSDLLNLIQADVALIPSNYFSQNGDGSWTLNAYGLYTEGDCGGGSADILCSNEPFRNQILAPFCSGFLVHSNVIVTAGHCLDGADPSDFFVVFDWKQQSSVSGPPINNIAADNLYEPESLDYVLTNGVEDWGVIYLNRDVVGRNPLPYRISGEPEVGTPLILVGHPWGLPMKVAPNAEVKSYPSGNYFEANTDSYAGNSGSMVVNANTWEVEGILVTGNADFTYSGGCCRSNVCSDSTGCNGNFEGVTKITSAKISDAFAIQPAVLLVAVAFLLLNAF